jgi:Contractile injection system tube protein
MLNPSSVVQRRLAGVKPRQSSSGPLTGAGLKNDPFLYTGGGRTEILLDLLFDVNIAGSAQITEDVRELTRSLTELAEGSVGEDGYGQVPLVRFIWGKAWNVLGIVAAVAERLESFTPNGAPQRSWLRMRFVRTEDATPSQVDTLSGDLTTDDLPEEDDVSPDELRFHETKGAGERDEDEGSSAERLDEIAASYYGNPAWWRVIANFNNIEDPTTVSAGDRLMIPPASSVGGKL